MPGQQTRVQLFSLIFVMVVSTLCLSDILVFSILLRLIYFRKHAANLTMGTCSEGSYADSSSIILG